MTEGKPPAAPTPAPEPQTQAPPASGDGAAGVRLSPVVVDTGWVTVGGCKVARVEPGGVLAFKDKCRGRSQRRGCSEVRVKVADLAQVVQASEKTSS